MQNICIVPKGLPAAETGFMSYRNVCKQLAQHVYFSLQQLLRKQTSLFTNEISYMKELKLILLL